MRYSPIYTPGGGREHRATRWMSRALEGAFAQEEYLWTDIYHDTTAISFTTASWVVGTVDVTDPPTGYRVYLEGQANVYQSAGSAVTFAATIQSGTAVLATSICYCPAPGSASVRLVAVWRGPFGLTATMRLERKGGGTALTLQNAGLTARYIQEM